MGSEKANAQQIEKLVLQETEGFFEDQPAEPHGPGECLRVTIRIAADFRDFLEKDESPTPDEISYMMGTIQSGIDHFVLFGHLCWMFSGLQESWIPELCVHQSFSRTKADVLRFFETLVATSSSPVERVASLLSLVRIQLAFFAHFYPWGVQPPLGDSQPL